MKIYFIYLTFKSLKEAKKISSKLVKLKLAACTNIIPAIYSTYVWKKKNAYRQRVFYDYKNFKIKSTKSYYLY